MTSKINADPPETLDERSLLDQLLEDSRLYKNSADYMNLLDFVTRLRNFAPFNAMLLQIQKPGLSYAASAREWKQRFGRYPVDGARPLLILWPFGPVSLVYDMLDTKGKPLPVDAFLFTATGTILPQDMVTFGQSLLRKNITCQWVDHGDQRAGSIKVLKKAKSEKEKSLYLVTLNSNHPLPVQFTTLAHELAHLFLGHLGFDSTLKIKDRRLTSHEAIEIEAESVAYLVCHRNGIAPRSQTYLSQFVKEKMTVKNIDLYQVMRAAGQVEDILKLNQKNSAKK